MKALVGAFNQKKALVGAFSVIVQPVVDPMEHHTALPVTVAIAILAAPRSSVSPPPLVAGGGGVSLAARPHVVRSADVPQKLHRVFVLNMTEYRYY